MGIMLCENMLLFCNTEREGWDTMGVLYCAHIQSLFFENICMKGVMGNGIGNTEWWFI